MKKQLKYVNDKECAFCGEITNHRKECYWQHLNECKQTIKQLKEGYDYLECPECNVKLGELGKHLRAKHNYTEKQLANLQLRITKVNEKSKKTCLTKYGVESPWQSDIVKTKKENTCIKKYGVKNPFQSEEIKDKIKKTNIEKFGVEHPMQNEEIKSKQFISAQTGMSGQEKFFNEHTCDNVVFVGYGGKYITSKSAVTKFGRDITRLNPDFMVFPDRVKDAANQKSKECLPLNKDMHRSRWVIELLGDYYHSEGITGTNEDLHVEQITKAYNSVNINVLILWEHEILKDWDITKIKVDKWINNAIEDMTVNPIYKKRKTVANKIDKRIGQYLAPNGERFLTQEKLDKWLLSDKNVYKSHYKENIDYVVCKLCNSKFKKLGRHLKSFHNISSTQYLKDNPNEKLICSTESERVGKTNSKTKHNGYKKRTVYRLPNGEIAKKKDKWMREWDNNPPKDSILDAKELDLDKWKDKILGIDYVECSICGYKGKNIKRHIKRQHDLENYVGEIQCSSSKDKIASASYSMWKQRV